MGGFQLKASLPTKMAMHWQFVGGLLLPAAYAEDNVVSDNLVVHGTGEVKLQGGGVQSPFGGLGRYENLLLHSEELNTWASLQFSAVNPNTITAPDGSPTADAFTGMADGTLSQSVTLSSDARGKTYTLSVWLKGPTAGSVQVTIRKGNWSTNTDVVSQAVSYATNWQRVSVSGTATDAAAVTQLTVAIGGFVSWVNGEVIHVWGAQLEENARPGVYVKTTTSQVSPARGLATDTLHVSGNLEVHGQVIQHEGTTGQELTGTLTIKGVDTDITTGPNEHLALMPNGTGNVGIGTTTPGKKLELVDNANDAYAGVNIKNQNASGSAAATITLTNDVGNSGSLQFFGSGTVMANMLTLVNDTSTGGIRMLTGVAERLRIASDGNVGIGTPSPAKKLHVDGDVQLGGTSYGSLYPGFGRLFLRAEAGSAMPPSLAFQDFDFATKSMGLNFITDGTTAGTRMELRDSAGSPLYSLTESGNLGIGTTSPGYPLDVRNNLGVTSGEHYLANFQRVSQDAEVLIGYRANGTAPTRAFVMAGNGLPLDLGTLGGTPQALSILTNGNVGIGAPVPGYKLDVQGGQVNASGGLCIAGDCKTAWNQVGGVAAGDSPTWTGAHTWAPTTDVIPALIKQTTAATPTVDIFRVANASDTTAFLRVAKDGNVGIGGVTSPGSPLTVRGWMAVYQTSGDGIKIYNPSVSYAMSLKAPNTGIAQIAVEGANKLTFATNAQERVRIDDFGNIGIGTTTPSLGGLGGSNTLLHLHSGSNQGAAMRLTTGGASPIWAFLQTYGSGMGLGTETNYPLLLYTNSAERMRIDTAGNVGIGTGTASVESRLNVVGPGNLAGGIDNIQVAIQNSDAFAVGKGGGLALAGKYDVAGNRAYFGSLFGLKENTTGGDYKGYLSFYSNPGTGLAEAMRISSSGNVGIGTPSPGALLDVNGRAKVKTLTFPASTTLIVSLNAVTVTQSFHLIDTSAGAQTVNTINGGAAGDIVFFKRSGANTLTFADVGTNIQTQAGRTLNADSDIIGFFFDGGTWLEIFVGDNA